MATLTDEVVGWRSRPGCTTLGNNETVVNLSSAGWARSDQRVEREFEDSFGVGRGRSGHLIGSAPLRPSDDRTHEVHERGLILLASVRNRGEERTIGLDEETL